MKTQDKIIFKKRILLIPVLLTIAAIVLVVLFIRNAQPLPSSSIFLANPKDIIPSNLILYDNLNTYSSDKAYLSFVTSEDLGMDNDKIWLTKADGSHPVIVAKSNELKYVSDPVFSPDSKYLAYMRIYPFEIWVYDITTGESRNVEPDTDRLAKYMNPALGYGGETYFLWTSNDTIGFENNSTFPAERYSININTKQIIKDGDAPVTDNSDLGNVSYLSQRDPAWGDVQLGACSDETIHSAGCAVTSMAMLLNAYGYKTDPEELNKFLTENSAQGYVDECNIKWYIIPNFAKGIKLTGAYFNEKNFDRINYQLDHGNPVIIGFNSVPFTSLQHWVVVTHRVGDTYYINDPWSLDQKEETLDDFGGKFDHLIVYEKETPRAIR